MSLIRLTVTAAVICGNLLAAWSPLAGDELPLKDNETRIFLANADGSAMKRLTDLPEYTFQGSPVWSRDGKQIAFDAWQAGEQNSAARIIVVNVDGTNPRVLGDGAMPSFSPGGNRIAFSRSSPNHGVWVMSSEGPEKELVLLDEQGWSAHWSPDGKKIAYAATTGQGTNNLAVFDLVEGDRTYLFDAGQEPYAAVYHNFAWSPDGRQIVFKGQTSEGKLEVAIVDTRGAKHGLTTVLTINVRENFAWSPDGARILVNFPCPERARRTQLYYLDPRTKDQPQLLPGQDPLFHHMGMAYSPDGARLAVSSRSPVGYAQYQLRQSLQRTGRELATRGQLNEALDVLAQINELPASRVGKVPLTPICFPLASRLADLPAGERYTLLRDWTMPAESTGSLRFVAAFLPGKQGPPDFTGPTAEVFSTLDLLVDAAREVRKLPELTVAARERVAACAPAAGTLLQLAGIASGQSAEVSAQFSARVAALTKPATPPARGVSWADFLVVRAALRNSEFSAAVEPLTRELIKRARADTDMLMLAHLRSELMQANVSRESGLPTPATADPSLALWRPAVHQSADNLEAFPMRSWWAADGRRITHLGSPSHTMLYFAWPLEGEFEFAMDTFRANWLAGNAGFAGQIFEGAHRNDAQAIWPVGKHEVQPLVHPFMRLDDFNRLTVRVSADGVHYLVNGRPIYHEADPSPTSPWLCLHARQSLHAAFRNLSLTGQPRIPRSVKLTHRDRLEGWISSFYGETQPPRLTLKQPAITPAAGSSAFDWSAHDGVIHGRRIEAGQPLESRLYYHRPLAAGETVHYEFYYEPGKRLAHPALDRLAFVLDPAGVRMHWMTDGAEQDPSGLTSDNAWDQPEHRRGASPLPLKSGDWNEVALTLADGHVTLDLNGEPIYKYPLPVTNDRLFGLFHYKHQTAVEVRNIVLSGDWPQALTEHQLTNLAALTTHENLTIDQRRQRTLLIGEQFIAREAEEVATQASRLSPADRYQFLLDWVLPSQDHASFRLYGYFTPMDPAPTAATEWLQASASPEARRAHVGGWLAAPALDLVETADELGKLDDLASRVAAATVAAPSDRRGQLALQALVHARGQDQALAIAALQQLAVLARQVPADMPDYLLFPDMVAAWGVMSQPPLRVVAMKSLDALYEQVKLGGTVGEIEKQFCAVRVMGNMFRDAPGGPPLYGVDPGLAYWQVVTRGAAATRGGGRSRANWKYLPRDTRLQHNCGHAEDCIYFALPLRGDFVFECQMNTRGMRIGYGGQLVGFRPPGGGKFDLVAALRSPSIADVQAPFEKLGETGRFRLVSAGGQVTYTIDGHLVHRQPLEADHDPWLIIREEGYRFGSVWNIRLTGEPAVPESLQLSQSPNLAGWLAEYYAESVSLPTVSPEGQLLPAAGGAWEWRDGEIYGVSAAARAANPSEVSPSGIATIVAGSHQESLLQYHRPMLEDGVLEYEFYYQPGQTLVHPAVDRLTFMLDPQGVKIHWLTDAQYERTGLTPDNLHVEAANRRGPAKLPLKPGQWNRAKITLTGDVVTLALNGADVCQRTLEPTNQRFFGLFHYADQTDVRVRNVTWRGDWLRQLPPAKMLFARQG